MPKRRCDISVKKKQKSTTKENQQQKRKLFLYLPTKVREALVAIQNGTPVSTASKIYQVPRTTLRHKIRGEAPVTTGHVGRESVLGSRVEAILVDWLLETCRMGFPITKDVLLNSVKKFVETEHLETPFTNNTPGRKWFENFMKRHPAKVMKAKEAEKQRQLEKKEKEKKIRLQKREEAKQIRLQKREEAKQIKLAAKRIKLEKRDEAKSKKKVV